MSTDDTVADYFEAFTGFGDEVTVAGVSVRGTYEANSELEQDDGVITRAPTLRLASTDAVGLTTATVVVANGTTHTVRQILPEPPDGALTRLVLVRT